VSSRRPLPYPAKPPRDPFRRNSAGWSGHLFGRCCPLTSTTSSARVGAWPEWRPSSGSLPSARKEEPRSISCDRWVSPTARTASDFEPTRFPTAGHRRRRRTRHALSNTTCHGRLCERPTSFSGDQSLRLYSGSLSRALHAAISPRLGPSPCPCMMIPAVRL